MSFWECPGCGGVPGVTFCSCPSRPTKIAETILTDEQINDEARKLYGSLATDQEQRLARAIEQAVLQSEQVQAWKKDAERYRWLRDRNLSDDTETEPWISAAKNDDERWGLSGDIADSRIDAAMEKQP